MMFNIKKNWTGLKPIDHGLFESSTDDDGSNGGISDTCENFNAEEFDNDHSFAGIRSEDLGDDMNFEAMSIDRELSNSSVSGDRDYNEGY